MEAEPQTLTVDRGHPWLRPEWEPWLLAALLGAATTAFGNSRAYFPQTDAFSYYQMFHYLYSSLYFHREIPLWEPYGSYGIPAAFELAFSIGPSKALTAVLGLLFHASDIKLLYFLAVGLDYATLSLATISILREVAPENRLAMLYAGVAMAALHMSEWQPCFGYGFCLPILLILLFVIRFFKTFDGLYVALCALTLIAFTFGSPQYFIVIEGYIGGLFGLLCAYAHRADLSRQAVRRMATSLCSVRSIAVFLLAGGLALALWQIDRDTLASQIFVVPGRDPTTLKVPLAVFLNYEKFPLTAKLMDILAGRPVSWDLMSYFGLTGATLLVFAALQCRTNRFVGPLLVTLAVIVMFALPELFPVARFAYGIAPGMDHYRYIHFALMFGKPFVVILAAVALVDIGRRGLRNGRARTLIRIGYALLVCASVFVAGAGQFGNFLNVAGLGVVALVCLAVSIAAAIWADLRPDGMRGGVALLAAITIVEPVAHRFLLDRALLAQIDQIRQSLPKGPLVEDWYRRPRALTYQAMREEVYLPPVPVVHGAGFYRGLWSFVGVDPCIPLVRSDSYGKLVGEGLERDGIPPEALTWGLFGLPPGVNGKAFACGSPKLVLVGDPEARILPSSFGPNHLALTVDASVPGLLTYSDAYHPGWKVSVDAESKPVLPTDAGFKSVALPAGTHRVVWTFEPLMNEWILGILGLTLACLAPAFLLLAGPRVRARLPQCRELQ